LSQPDIEEFLDRRGVFFQRKTPLNMSERNLAATFYQGTLLLKFWLFVSSRCRRSAAAVTWKVLNIKTVFVGNIPDFDRKDCFYTKITPNPGELRDHQSQIGIWRSREDFTKLAHDTGWFSSMPAGFYQIHYR
jgi:hypothetical protein